MKLRIEKIITCLDVFGQGINLTIDKQTKSKTFFGGLLSILLSIFVASMFYFYGDDFFYKTNPQTSNEIQMLNIILMEFVLDQHQNQCNYSTKYFLHIYTCVI